MKTASAALINLLNTSTTLATADLFTFTLSGGTTLRYTTWDQDVTLSGVTWSKGPLIRRTGIKWKIGVEVDSMKVTIEDDGSNRVSGTPIVGFAAAGGFDNARLRLERAFGSAPGTWTGSLFMFSGLVSQIQGARMTLEMDVKSELTLLDAKVPRHVFQSRCLNVVFDGTCGLNAASFTYAGTVSTAVTGNPVAFDCSFTPALAQVLDQGYVVFTSGANAGQRRTIKTYTGTTVVLIQPLPAALGAGDTFQAVPGCDGLQGTCSTFGNSSRYRGFPFIPVAETVL